MKTIESKKNKFAVDGALIERFMEENSKHLPNIDFIDLYKVLLKASGFIYNTNSILPYHISRRDGTEASRKKYKDHLYNGWIENALKTDNSKWELIEDLDELEEYAKQWYALFYHNNKSAAEIAKNNNHHAFSSNMVLSEFSKFARTRKEFKKPTTITAKDFFSPFDHPSKSYVIFDPQILTNFYRVEKGDLAKTVFGFERIKKENGKPIKPGVQIGMNYYQPTKEIENLVSTLFFYIDWIDKNIKEADTNIRPDIYIVCKTNDGPYWAWRKDMIILEMMFKKYVMNQIETKGDMTILKEYLSSNKVHFVYIEKMEFKKHKKVWGETYLHGNRVIADYGSINWDFRKRYINPTKDIYTLTYSAGKLKETQQFLYTNIFQEDFSKTGEWENFYKVFNEIIENDKNKRRECINNHLINEGIIKYYLEDDPKQETVYYNKWVKELKEDRELSWIYNRLSKVLKICYALCFQLAFLEQMTTKVTMKTAVAQLKKKWN